MDSDRVPERDWLGAPLERERLRLVDVSELYREEHKN